MSSSINCKVLAAVLSPYHDHLLLPKCLSFLHAKLYLQLFTKLIKLLKKDSATTLVLTYCPDTVQDPLM